MLNIASTPMLKSPRELRTLLHECGFTLKKRRGKEEIWEHPMQPGFQAVLLVPDLHAAHRRQYRSSTGKSKVQRLKNAG